MLTIYVLPNFIRGDPNEKRSQITARSKKDDDLSTASNESTKMGKKDENDEEKDEQAIAITTSTTIDPDESSNSSSGCSSFNNSMNDINQHIRKTDTNYLLKDLISKEVNKIKDETDNLSNLLKGKIEAANIEGLIDKTMSGIVELKDDLMRMNEPEVYSSTAVDNLRKRNVLEAGGEFVKGSSSGESSIGGGGVDAFLKKEIDAIKKEATVIPAVLSNANSAK
jgi:hypothetical protein